MKISKMRLTCKCGNVFDGEIVVQAPIAVSIASMKAVTCPKCGNNKNLGMGGELGGKPSVSDPIEHRAAWWIKNGDVGISSKTIYGIFAGDRIDSPDVPKDPSDYWRCRALFDLIPEWRAGITKLTEVYSWYGPFVDRWDKMDRLWNEESPTKRCPKLYHLLKLIEVESLRIRYPNAQIETRSDGSLSSMHYEQGLRRT